MATGLTLVCPVRGRLKATSKSKDGLTPTEEKFRVEAIRHLINAGYPKANIRVEAVIKRFGNSGRNSFRADIIVLDVPVASVPSDVDSLLAHALILGEVKRDSAAAPSAVEFQVKPMLDFAKRHDCVALYWDDVEQRVFWQTVKGGRRTVQEGPLTDLPVYGAKPGASRLTFSTIDPDKPLLAVFARIEDILHAASVGPSKRFGVMLQLLLAKLHDEHQHETTPQDALIIQDFAALEVDPAVAMSTMNALLAKAVLYYQTFLPEKVSPKFPITGQTLLEIMRVLAPVKIITMRQSVIQDFYMYFAKHIYKWDLAQYFTPTTVTDFIVEVLNPRWGEHVKDPACGSADFLTAAFRRGQSQGWADYSSSLWGTDVSPEAVQVAVLNMILNGDGKTNIHREDALAKVVANEQSCDVVICNPPFGKRILEKNSGTLGDFELGREWKLEDGKWTVSGEILKAQETGILFAELCVRLLRPGGRMALVVPNGYLGNRSSKYIVLRDWLLRHTRIAAIVALPRFTFKGSGADVSASVIFAERRETPLLSAVDDADYDFAVEVIDRVGWVTGDKKGRPTYRRDATDGTYILDDNDELILDSDFTATLAALRTSDAAQFNDWLLGDGEEDGKPGWSRSIGSVASDDLRTLDPKRLCRKTSEVVDSITSREHFTLGEVVDFAAEGVDSIGNRQRPVASTTYNYVEIADVEVGSFRWTTRLGWELPDRARHFAEEGDIYVGGIWNSVRKWFLVGAGHHDLVVTNGMHRLRLKPGKESYLLDLVAGLCSEAYGVQMRGMARGSDGLAEISPSDAANVVLPRIKDEVVRGELQPFVDQLLGGFTTVEAKVSSLLQANRLPIPIPPKRPDHTSVV